MDLHKLDLECLPWKMVQEILQEILWENIVGNSCEKILRENLVGNYCGKLLQEILARKSCRKWLNVDLVCVNPACVKKIV